MAIARGAGTEIIRSVLLENVTSTSKNVIYGVQHHIYTVLSVIIHADVVNISNTYSYFNMRIVGYDSAGGDTAQHVIMFSQKMTVKETFVWNDKFSFNGYEPVDFAVPLNTEAKQDLIADQGNTSDIRQILQINGEHGADSFDVVCTYIDQNNA